MTLPCIICEKVMEDIDLDWNQPYKGTVCLSYGQYGSTVWDSFDESHLEFNICDPCLVKAAEANRVLLYKSMKDRQPTLWDPAQDNGVDHLTA